MKISVYNLEGQETGSIELSEHIFGVKVNPDMLHQVVVSLSGNKRIYTAHTKNKGEVRGGGKKPWKQKGTGRARAGSSRSPIWKGGGVTFGPRNERNYSTKINKKVGKLAFSMALSAKLKDEEIKVIDSFSLKEGKTKLLKNALNLLIGEKNNALLVFDKKNENLKLASNNLQKIEIKNASDVNTLDVLSKKMVLLEKDAILKLEERFKQVKKSLKSEDK